MEDMKKLAEVFFLLSAALLLASCADVEAVLRAAQNTAAAAQERAAEAAEDEGAGAPYSLPETAGGREPTAGFEEEAAVSSESGQQEDETSMLQMPAEQEIQPQAGTEVELWGYLALPGEEERQLYREILASLQGLEQESELTTRNPELLESVFKCVMADHPEIFYVDGYTSTTYKLGSEWKKITFSGDYTMTAEEIAARSIRLEAAVAEWLSGLPDGDDYEKVKYLYEYLISHTDYELESADSQNICSVLLNGRSVCQGYAKAFQLLCQRSGIPAFLVTGTVNGQGHAWNLVAVDGQWYYVDPTWGDASYRQEESGYPQSAYPAVNYDYFCVTTEQISRTHVFGGGQTLPFCDAVQAQYYRREGLYLEQADLEQIAAIFERAAQQNAELVTFQCADEDVYKEVYHQLIEEQRVFDFLPGEDKTIAYAESPEAGTFCFWF